MEAISYSAMPLDVGKPSTGIERVHGVHGGGGGKKKKEKKKIKKEGSTKRVRPPPSVYEEEEDEKSMVLEPPRKRIRARVNVRSVNIDELSWNLHIFRNCPYTANCVNHLVTLTMTGGARVTIGDLVDLHDYTASVEDYLMEQLEKALHWIMIAGFIPFCVHPDDETLQERVSGNMQILFDVIEPQLIGSYEAYFNTATRRTEIRFIKTWKTYEGEEDDDDAQDWFVYCHTPPDEEGSIVSPVSQIRPDFRALDAVFKPADLDGTLLATHPLVVDEERPPQKGSPYSRDDEGFRTGQGFSTAPPSREPGYPRTGTGTGPTYKDGLVGPREYIPEAQELERQRDIRRRRLGVNTLHVPAGRTHSAVVVSHAYTSAAQRTTDYIRTISSALQVPYHIIDPLQHKESKAGTSALNKRPAQSADAGAKKGRAKDTTNNASSSYSADPMFVPALRYRKILEDFVKCVLAVKFGSDIARVLKQFKKEATEQVAMQEAIIAEMEEMIKKARDSIVKHDPTKHYEAAVKAVEDKNAKEARDQANAAKASGGSGGKVNPPEPTALPDPAKSVVSPEVEELTKKRDSIQSSVLLLSDAVQKLSSIKDEKNPFRLKWRQPFITDTANVLGVAALLNLPPEETTELARQRLGV